MNPLPTRAVDYDYARKHRVYANTRAKTLILEVDSRELRRVAKVMARA